MQAQGIWDGEGEAHLIAIDDGNTREFIRHLFGGVNDVDTQKRTGGGLTWDF